ncbi:EamA family transporter [Methanolobus sp. ZRKC2]|uniref:DMT family transporter n=1 Tax=Methanolobus sp. ZRKC2 TaxID=3125783 RepID=UPI00324C51F9
MSTTPKIAYMELITGSIIFGMLGIFVDQLDAVPTLPMIFYKQFFGLLSLMVFIIIAGKLATIKPHKKKRYLLLLGIINTTTLLTYFICIRYTSFSVAILLLYTAPMYVTLLSAPILKETITRKGLVALCFSLIGLLFIVDLEAGIEGLRAGGSEYLIGITAGILSGLSFGIEIINIRYIKDDYSSVAQLFWYTLIGIVLLLPFAGDVSKPVLIDNLGMLILFGAVNTALAALLYVSGIAQIKAQTGSILALFEPVSGIFFDFTVVHTPIHANTLIGCFFILLGAAMAVTEKSSKIFGKYFKIQV